MSTRGITVNVQVGVDLVTETCIDCGVMFGLLADLKQELRRSYRNFYCPNGHPMCYTAKTPEEELREKLERTEQRLAWYTSTYDQQRAEIKDLSKQVAVQKAQKTRLLRRVTNGVCPCCQRSFADVQRHMERQHPEQVVSAEQATSSS